MTTPQELDIHVPITGLDSKSLPPSNEEVAFGNASSDRWRHFNVLCKLSLFAFSPGIIFKCSYLS
jgi:hypothetical protein